MRLVLLTSLGVGGATVFGSLLGFAVKRIPKRFSDLTISFAAGIMLAAVWGLLAPAVESNSRAEVVKTVVFVVIGALFIGLCEAIVPKLRFVAGECGEAGEADSVIMLALAMFIHNMPEGMAAGVSLGSGNLSGALAVAGGIALQNIPEGMAVIPPMLAVGMSKRRAFFISLLTGMSEVGGTFLGYYATRLFSGMLIPSLAFAGGAMIYVIAAEMMPYVGERGKLGAYVFVVGICLMMLFSALI